MPPPTGGPGEGSGGVGGSSSSSSGGSSAGAGAPRVVRLGISPIRVRQWINRLPFFTRITLFVTIVLQFAGLISPRLIHSTVLLPSKISFTAAHRLNTYPFVHTGLVQAIFSLIALIPLLDRFEAEHGTLVTIAMFLGPFSTLPALLYLLVDHVIFRQDDLICGSSIFVFLLLACEAVKQGRAHPSLSIAGLNIPTWATTILVILLLNFLIPHTSLLGHLCGALTGYGFELGILKFLVPPERVLRWIEAKLNLLGRLPHYVSVDQTTFGRYGVLPSREPGGAPGRSFLTGSTQRLGP